MSCDHCNCLDCARNRAIDDAIHICDMEDMGRSPPIHRPSWQDVEPANDVQTAAWMGYINEVYDDFSAVKVIPMMTLLSMVCQKIRGLKIENYYTVHAQIERLIRESDHFELHKGRNGGFFRKQFFVGSHAQTAAGSDRSVGSAPLVNNCTCKGCGTGLNTSEKTCWKCGATQ